MIETVRTNLDEAQARPAVLHAAWAFMVCSNWWGMPGYPDQVSRLIETGRIVGSGTGAALKDNPAVQRAYLGTGEVRAAVLPARPA